MSKKRKYPGILSKPISTATADPSPIDLQIELKARFDALFRFYKIDQKDSGKWGELASALAFRHVPGLSFSPNRKVGRPPRWDIHEMVKLVEAVQGIKDDRGISTSAAIRSLQKNDPLLKKVSGLQRRYYEAKKQVELLDGAAYWEALYPGLRDILAGRKRKA
jgi:hypothetical protein